MFVSCTAVAGLTILTPTIVHAIPGGGGGGGGGGDAGDGADGDDANRKYRTARLRTYFDADGKSKLRFKIGVTPTKGQANRITFNVIRYQERTKAWVRVIEIGPWKQKFEGTTKASKFLAGKYALEAQGNQFSFSVAVEQEVLADAGDGADKSREKPEPTYTQIAAGTGTV